jgi:predicted ArsR family transcriptional regulator
MANGYVERSAAKAGRGRPCHHYVLTKKGRRGSGANLADLAVVLWEEIREIKEPSIRMGLLRRISKRLAGVYAAKMHGESVGERMAALVEVFRERRVPAEVSQSGESPALSVFACPYPDLADEDRSTCAMERMLFSELLGEGVQLTECRLDGDHCCTFRAN